MKKMILFYAAFVSALLFVACNSKGSTIEQLSKLNADVSANGENYTKEDWDQFLRKYNEIDSLLGTYELTPEERHEVGRLKGECSGFVIKANARKVNSKVDEMIDEASGFMEGLINTFSE